MMRKIAKIHFTTLYWANSRNFSIMRKALSRARLFPGVQTKRANPLGFALVDWRSGRDSNPRPPA